MQLAGAGKLIQGLLGTRIGKAMLAPATKEAAKASVPGAVLSGAFTAVGGGGLPATLATTGLDVGLSTAGARLAGKVTPQAITNLVGQGPKRQAVANFIAGATNKAFMLASAAATAARHGVKQLDKKRVEDIRRLMLRSLEASDINYPENQLQKLLRNDEFLDSMIRAVISQQSNRVANNAQ